MFVCGSLFDNCIQEDKVDFFFFYYLSMFVICTDRLMCASVGVKCEQMLELKLHYRRIRSVLIFKDVARVFCDGEKNFPSFVIPDNFYS